MVYKRRNYRRRGPKKPWYTKKYSALEIAGKAWTMAKYTKSLLNVERKKIEVSAAALSLTTAGLLTHLTAVPAGDGSNQRDGISILCKSLNLKGFIRPNGSDGLSRMVRISLLCDTQQIGDTVPGYTDVYSSSSVISHLNHTTVGRFTILKEMTFILNPNDLTLRSFDWYIPLTKHARYNGPAATDIQKNGLYIATCVDDQTNAALITFDCRLSYTDN